MKKGESSALNASMPVRPRSVSFSNGEGTIGLTSLTIHLGSISVESQILHILETTEELLDDIERNLELRELYPSSHVNLDSQTRETGGLTIRTRWPIALSLTSR
jgi:hypothetical protein